VFIKFILQNTFVGGLFGKSPKKVFCNKNIFLEKKVQFAKENIDFFESLCYIDVVFLRQLVLFNNDVNPTEGQ